MEGGGGYAGGKNSPQQCNISGGEPKQPWHGGDRGGTATFEERFQQFYLQLAEGKTGGMVVSELALLHNSLLYLIRIQCIMKSKR